MKLKKPVCPFFLGHSAREIRCEGMVAESCLQAFENALRKRDWYRQYCGDFGYRICPYYRAAEKKYDGGEKHHE